jgi:hypothetical protein
MFTESNYSLRKNLQVVAMQITSHKPPEMEHTVLEEHW